MLDLFFGGKRSRHIYVLILLCLPLCSTAQILSLPDAVNSSVANYPQLRQRAAEVNAARAHINTTNGNRLPSLLLHDQLTAGSANALQGAYFPMGIVPSLSGSAATQQNSPVAGNVAISYLQWEFYNFGYYKAQRNGAKAQLATSEAALGGDRYQLIQEVVSVYLDWLKKYQLLQVARENMERANVILTSIRATVLSGLKPGVDSSTAGAAYSASRISYLQATDELNYDRIALLSYTGQAGPDLVPDTVIIGNALLQELALLPMQDSVAAAHPLINVYRAQYEQELANVQLTAKKYLPRLGVDGAGWVRNSGISYTGDYPGGLADGMPYSRYNYLFGLTFSYNLFDLKHRHDQLAEGRLQAAAKLDAVQTEQLTLNRMMQQAEAAYATTREKMDELPRQLAAAKQAYGQQQALYRSGLNTLIEVTNAQYALLQAETTYVITRDELLQLLYMRAALAGQQENFLQHLKH